MERSDVSYLIRGMTIKDVRSIEALEPDQFTIIYPGVIYERHVKYFPKLSLVVDINDNLEGFIIVVEGITMIRTYNKDNIGSIATNHSVLYGHITSLFITESNRRCGFGGKLMNEFEENCKMMKCIYVNLFVNYRNTSAIEFYKKRNYYIYNVIPKYYDDNEDALEMRKNLVQ